MILVTDPRFTLARTEHVIDAVGRELATGVFIVQLRDKSSSARVLASTARALRLATARLGVRFVLNAPSEQALRIALDVEADGVHVPCRPEVISEAAARFDASAWLSAPAHTDADVTLAAAAGARAVLVSPIFETPDKGPARGVGAIASARRRSGTVAVYALGGVSPMHAAACAAAGADGVAVIRALLDAADPAAVARELDAAFRGPREA